MYQPICKNPSAGASEYIYCIYNIFLSDLTGRALQQKVSRVLRSTQWVIRCGASCHWFRQQEAQKLKACSCQGNKEAEDKNDGREQTVHHCLQWSSRKRWTFTTLCFKKCLKGRCCISFTFLHSSYICPVFILYTEPLQHSIFISFHLSWHNYKLSIPSLMLLNSVGEVLSFFIEPKCNIIW